MPPPFETTIIFGEAATRAYHDSGTTDSDAISNLGGYIETFTFTTQGELDAFHKGLAAVDGYFEHETVD